MTKFVILLALSVLTSNAFAAITLKGCNSYGPTEKNLAVSVDYFEKVVYIGFQNEGGFYSMIVSGCNPLRLSGSSVLCSSEHLGEMGTAVIDATEAGNQPVAPLVITTQKNILIECPNKGLPRMTVN